MLALLYHGLQVSYTVFLVMYQKLNIRDFLMGRAHLPTRKQAKSRKK